MPSNLFVVVWRTPPSQRLRTYVTPENQPRAFALDALSPLPTRVITSLPELEEFLQESQDQTAAISRELAESYLGWEPVP